MNGNAGVLLTAHGSVEDLDELPEFLARIRHGRMPPPELVEEVRRRYVVIGGSPHLRITNAQAAALESALGLPVFVGMRLARPELGTALEAAFARGLRTLCVLPVAPFSVHVYQQAAARALEERALPGLELVPVEPWGSAPELVAAQARLIAPHLASPERTLLLLTAHSLPTGVIAAGDPYQRQFEASARALENALGHPVRIAYQSQGLSGGSWLGPDLRTELERAAQEGARRVVIAPIGFLADHVETLYDLDVEARTVAEALGLAFVRVPALNTDPGLVAALAAVARRALFR
ncbi:MAG TPA: ferrochelatase [Polyangiaceae bacterium]|nr:ferrochelatase [Polyangiaceae bacterium]